MPAVIVSGNLRDHGLANFPPGLKPRLFFKPNKGHITGSYAMDGDRIYADLQPDGSFTVQLYSEPSNPDVWYTLCLDWLPPGRENEPTKERSRGWFEWPQRIYPDTGGPLGDLIDLINGVGMVYYAADAPRKGVRMQLHFNTSTDDLYAREITW